MSEHHPEETMAIVASETDPVDLPDELIDELLAGARTPEEITGADGLLQRLTKWLVERAMAAELTDHLGYEHGEAPPGGAGNARNGTTPKPRDRRGARRRARVAGSGRSRTSTRSCSSTRWS